jgi:hypothetical protein
MKQTDNLSPKRESIINRILALSDEQFELLITLYSQQSEESSPDDPSLLQTSA